MGLKLEWKPSDRMGVEAECGGCTLHVMEGASLADMMAGRYVMYEWRVFRHSWSMQVGVRSADEPRNTLPTMVEAQEAAEAAAARLLADDAGVRALLGLRWIPVTEGLPPEGVEVLVHTRWGAQSTAHYRRWHATHCSWVWAQTGDGTVYDFAAEDVTHWRPLGAGPVAATSADSANLAATAEEVES